MTPTQALTSALWGELFVHSRPFGRRATRWLYLRYLRSQGNVPRRLTPEEHVLILFDIRRLSEREPR